MIPYTWESPCSLINLNMKRIVVKIGLSKLGLFSFRTMASALILLALLSSCTRPENELGLNLQPEGDLLSTYYTDTMPMITSVVKMDSLMSSGASSVILGNYYDPVFGHTRASFFAQLRLTTNGIAAPDVYEIDSVVLAMVYTGNLYGSLRPQYLEVFEMTDTLSSSADSTYYTNSFPAFDNSMNLVDPGHEVQYMDIDQAFIEDGDSLLPQIRIPLRKSLGERFFSEYPDSVANNTIFSQYFEGLYVRSRTDDAACVNFNLNNSDSRVTIYYRDLSGEQPDTLSYVFSFGTLSKKFTHFEHQYTPASLYALDTYNSLPNQEECYVQAGAGLMTRIEFPDIMSVNDYEGRAVNLARLYLPVSDLSNGRCCPIQDQLLLYGVDDDGKREALPSNWDINVVLEPLNNRYRINITRWVQDVLNGNRPNNGLYLVSVNGSVSVNRVVLNGPEFDVSDPSKNMRLELAFSN